MPQEFWQYLAYCRSLEFEETPDYKLLIGLFRSCLKRDGYNSITPWFCWNDSSPPRKLLVDTSQETNSTADEDASMHDESLSSASRSIYEDYKKFGKSRK